MIVLLKRFLFKLFALAYFCVYIKAINFASSFTSYKIKFETHQSFALTQSAQLNSRSYSRVSSMQTSAASGTRPCWRRCANCSTRGTSHPASSSCPPTPAPWRSSGRPGAGKRCRHLPTTWSPLSVSRTKKCSVYNGNASKILLKLWNRVQNLLDVIIF